MSFVLSSIGIRMARPQSSSSSGLWNCTTYKCRNASLAEVRLFGLNCRQELMRSRTSTLPLGKILLIRRFWPTDKDSSMVAAKGDLMASMSSTSGWPVISTTHSNWFIVEVPGKIGFPDTSSPNMQPTLHKSTPFVYDVEPSRISGARYQRVAT